MSGRVAAAALFGAGSLICLGLALALAEECFAVLTGRAPTISAVTATAITKAPQISVAAMCATCVLIGALIAHFTDWLP